MAVVGAGMVDEGVLAIVHQVDMHQPMSSTPRYGCDLGAAPLVGCIFMNGGYANCFR